MEKYHKVEQIIIAYVVRVCYNITTKSLEVQYGYITNSY